MDAKFITFEGIDFSGKSTQCDLLSQFFEEQNIPHILTKEPGGSGFGNQVRALIKSQSATDQLQPLTEALLLFAARGEHLARVIAPALARGQWVICDRFIDSTFAYQGAAGVSDTTIDTLISLIAQILPAEQKSVLTPDVTFFMDIDIATRATRIKKHQPAGSGQSELFSDRYDNRQLEFFSRVQHAYRARCEKEPQRIIAVNANLPAKRIGKKIITQLQQRFGL